MTRPTITLTSDFGLADAYVAEMKSALLRACPDAHLVDVTHLISVQDVTDGAIVLERAVRAFDPGAESGGGGFGTDSDALRGGVVHLAVVDPGVGTDRRLLAVEIAGQWVVCPDNGLVTWAWRRLGGGAAHEIVWRPAQASATFHGRDILAPVAGRLAAGEQIAALAQPIDEPMLLALAPSNGPVGKVIHIDHFGNATTNVPAEHVTGTAVRVKGQFLPLRRTYCDVEPGEPLALIGSGGLVEIAVRNGSAAEVLGMGVEENVEIVSSSQQRNLSV